MAYIRTEHVNAIRAALKIAFPRWRFACSKDRSSTLLVKILSGPLDLPANTRGVQKIVLHEGQPGVTVGAHYDVNTYYLDRWFSGDALAAIEAIASICMFGNHDNSDSQTDYFDVGWYFNLQIGNDSFGKYADYVCDDDLKRVYPTVAEARDLDKMPKLRVHAVDCCADDRVRRDSAIAKAGEEARRKQAIASLRDEEAAAEDALIAKDAVRSVDRALVVHCGKPEARPRPSDIDTLVVATEGTTTETDPEVIALFRDLPWVFYGRDRKNTVTTLPKRCRHWQDAWEHGERVMRTSGLRQTFLNAIRKPNAGFELWVGDTQWVLEKRSSRIERGMCLEDPVAAT